MENDPAAQTARLAAAFPWPFRNVYAAKFLCGELKKMPIEGPVEPGSYSTAINVHNPNWHPVALRKKAILLFDASHPDDAVERPTPPVNRERPVIKELGPDWGLEIDCRDIRQLLLEAVPGQPGPEAPIFIKGWVVIETFSDALLDVVAVYTVEPLGSKGSQPLSITIDRVPGRRLVFPGS